MNISGQAFDTLGALLHLLADPKAYEDQLSVLRKAIDDNKKYVELIAPAGEIMNLLEVQRKNTAAAEARLAAAAAESRKMAEAAENAKQDVLRAAGAQAEALLKDAAETKAAAQAEMVNTKEQKAAVAAAEKSAAEHKEKSEALVALREALEQERAALKASQSEVDSLRAELAAKLDKLRDL
jgi:chromosome segregation ATPase